MTASIIKGYVPGSIGRIAEMHGKYYHRHAGFGCYFEAKVAKELSEFLYHYNEENDGLWLIGKNGQVEGSIAIDGISLTVVALFPDSFTVSIIPHTAAMTTLGFKKPGATVNLEADIIGRYVERLLKWKQNENGSQLSAGFLAEHGFI